MTVVTAAQHRPAALRGHQQVQRLRGSDQEIRRPLQHRGTLSRRGIPGPHRHPDLRCRQPELGGHRGDLGQRPLKVLPDIDGQRLQRRHVDNLRPVTALARLPRARGRSRSMQTRNAASVLPEPVGAAISVCRPAAISSPAPSLRLRRPGREPPLKPGTHGRVERLQHAATLTRAADSRPAAQPTRTGLTESPVSGLLPRAAPFHRFWSLPRDGLSWFVEPEFRIE